MADAAAASLPVTVVWCPAPHACVRSELQLAPGATVADALRASGLAEHLREEAGLDVGVWGRHAALDQPLRAHDRVEVYRPLRVDPKVARRERFRRQGTRAAGLFARPNKKPPA